jgi:hypothetical protein
MRISGNRLTRSVGKRPRLRCYRIKANGVAIPVITACIRAIFSLCACLTLSGSALAATYWVSPVGRAAWAACRSDTPLSGTAACSISRANRNASAGDTVYFRGGTYALNARYEVGISPTHSGTSASTRITFANAPGETPVLEGRGCNECGWGIDLNSGTGPDVGTYIRITGITFHNVSRWAMLRNYANYNEIDHCTFYTDDGNWVVTGFLILSWCDGGSTGSCYSTHNWIHHNYFSKAKMNGNSGNCVEGDDVFRIGDGSPLVGDEYLNDNNTVENNYFEYAGHALFDSYGNKTVFVNNILHNEPWYVESQAGCSYPNDQYSNPAYNGKYGHRVFHMSTNYERDGNYNLIEGSRFGFGSTNPNNDGADSLDLASAKTIVRYNDIFGAMNSGLMFKYGYNQLGHPGTNNRVYNNTFYHNGHGNPWYESAHAGCTTCPEQLFGIRFYYPTSTQDNVVRNNIVYDSRRYVLDGSDIDPSAAGINTIGNNWLTTNGDPKFSNADLSDPTSQNLFSSVHGYVATPIPNLSLQPTSPAINGGAALTQAVGAGSGSTTLVVKDALYFQDGTWGSDLARGVTFFADSIAIGTVTNVFQIRSINYDTNTITLASPATWSDKANIWLYKKSDGAVVLSGAAPDFGAHEFTAPSQSPLPPTSLPARTKSIHQQ